MKNLTLDFSGEEFEITVDANGYVHCVECNQPTDDLLEAYGPNDPPPTCLECAGEGETV